MKAEYEEKFIVINRKRFKELKEQISFKEADNILANLNKALVEFYEACFYADINTSQTYYVCNQDEPYAKDVIETILKGESAK